MRSGGGSGRSCGTYWGYGFHEDGVRGAYDVARLLGAQPRARRARTADDERALRGYGPPPTARGRAPRAPPPTRHGLRGPRRARSRGALGGGLSPRRGAFARSQRSDDLGDPALPPDAAAGDLVEEQTGLRPEGPVRLLTQLRTAGWSFDPTILSCCSARGGERLGAAVFEVTSTPRREQKAHAARPARTRASRHAPARGKVA